MTRTAPRALKDRPGMPELYISSLIATAMVYLSGIVLFAGLSYFGSNSGGWQAVGQLLGLGLVWGIIPVAAAALMVIAPLGCAFGLIVLRFTPAGWWQGPLTGALCALSLEAVVFLAIQLNSPHDGWDWGNVVTLSIPVALAMIAGRIVQQRFLDWPDNRLTA